MRMNWERRKIEKRLMPRHLDLALKEHEQIVELYKREHSTESKKRDWRTYEQQLARRIKLASQELEPVLEEAFSMINVEKPMGGRPMTIPISKRVMILLLKDIFGLSNRRMANMLAFFTALSGTELSYKSIERTYSDELAKMTIHNAYMILLKKKGIKHSDASGDGTGYSLTVTRHYRNVREKELKKLKNENEGKNTDDGKSEKKAKAFAYAFAMMDLQTWMYTGYGTSMRSEKEAYYKALKMSKSAGIEIDSVRLDKYYSCQSITEDFGSGTKIYVMPKKNATIEGGPEWRRIVKSFITDPFGHLGEYYRRNNSESGFSADKRLSGWKVWQKREDRIDTAIMCKGLWHNMMRLG